MADLRNDIAELQARLYGHAPRFPGDGEETHAVPDSWRTDEDGLEPSPDGPPLEEEPPDTGADTGSGEDSKDRRGLWGPPKRSKKRKLSIRSSDWTN